MPLKPIINTGLFLLLLISTNTSYAQPKAETFTGWEDLNNRVPEWLKDAKFGIYFHWGVYNVPAYNSEWYSRSMYVPGTTPYNHHIKTYGPQNKFGYKDFIPMFKAEHFNADEWVELFAKAGAKFAGPVAEHADGFSMWDSKVNPYNAKDMGPKKDIVKAMEKAVRKRGLKFITTFHHQWHWGWYPTFDSSVDASDPKHSRLYGPLVSKLAWQQNDSAERPSDAFNKLWYTKVKEVVKKYKPDMLYFDSRLSHISQDYRKQMVTTFFKASPSRNQKVILHKFKELPDGVGLRTYEKIRLKKLSDSTWLTEEPISTFSWSYTEDIEVRTAASILHGLIDVVSKNGIYLLNLCPKADGTIPADQKDRLLTVGNWLSANGHAIYNTRPWYMYGEGPVKETEDTSTTATTNRRKYFELKFTGSDIRYTKKGNVINAIMLGKPAGKNILLTAFDKGLLPAAINVVSVKVPATNEVVKWTYQNDGLLIEVPASLNNELANVLQIEIAASK